MPVDYSHLTTIFDMVKIDFATSDAELTRRPFSLPKTQANGWLGGYEWVEGWRRKVRIPLYLLAIPLIRRGMWEVPKLGKIKTRADRREG